MKQTITTLFAFLLVFTSFGQEDKSKQILKDVNEKNQAYKTTIVSFTMTITADGQDPFKQSGKAYMKEDKYFVSLTDQEIYNDGTTMTTYLKEENECYTSLVADNDEDIVSPSQLFSVSEEEYNSKYYKSTEFAGKPVHQIHLYPKKPKASKFHTIILKIEKATNEILYVLIKGKDGTKTKYVLKNVEHDVEISDAKFVFNEASHPGVECYDE